MLPYEGVKIEEEQRNVMNEGSGQVGPFCIRNKTGNLLEESQKKSEWSPLQNAKYAVFIEKNYLKMEGKAHNKLWIIHQQMAKFIKTRNFRQCKLHHQKLVSQFREIPKIIASFFSVIPQFQALFLKEKQNLNSGGGKQMLTNSSDQKSLKNSENEEKIFKDDLVQTDDIYRESKTEIMSLHPKMGSLAPSFIQNSKMLSNEKARKWGQCHMYFMEWTSRLNDLMSVL